MKEMGKKTKIIFLVVLFIIVIASIILLSYNYNIKNESENYYSEIDSKRKKLNQKISYEENTSENYYIIYDENGSQIDIVYNEDGLEFYKDHPDFNPTFGVYQEASEDSSLYENNVDADIESNE